MRADQGEGAFGTSEQVETPEDGIFCAILNIVLRKPGLMLMPSLGHQLLAVTHWKSLCLPQEPRGWCEQGRGQGTRVGSPVPLAGAAAGRGP